MSTESRAKSKGYKIVNHDGQPYYCKEIAELGTRIARQRCMTPEQYEQLEDQIDSERESLRRSTSKCSGTSGVCGAGAG
jgi:hypothetical protein